MRTRHLTIIFAAFVVIAGLLAASPAGAATAGVIVASDTTTGTRVVFSAADGGSRTVLPYADDVSHRGPWELLFVKAASTGRPELFAAGPGSTGEVQLTADPALSVGTGRWSVSGAKVAWTATRADGTTWLYTADVVRDATGGAAGLSGIAPVVELSPSRPFSWAGDDRRLATTIDVAVPGSGATRSDVVVIDVNARTVTNVTVTAAVDEYLPTFSPVADRIAYVQRTNKSGSVRNDVFVLDLRTRKVTQVTQKSNANLAQIASPSYSPDGTAIAFSAWPLALGGPAGIYRIDASGSGKAVNLTAGDGHSYLAPLWRMAAADR